MNRYCRTTTKGFTLIELVVVIALLGILAAFAIPRFAGLEREARTATTLALSGSIRSAAALVHSLWLSQGVNPVVVEGTPIAVTEGYPDASDIEATLSDIYGFTVTVNGTNDQAVFAKNGTSGPCRVVYNDALPDSAPVIDADFGGC